MKIIKIGAVWCPGCLIMNPRWNKIKEQYNDIEFIDYDYDLDEIEVKKFNVGNVLPVVVTLDDENIELERLVGEYSMDDLTKIMSKY